jgi:hypothetical protein
MVEFRSSIKVSCGHSNISYPITEIWLHLYLVRQNNHWSSKKAWDLGMKYKALIQPNTLNVCDSGWVTIVTATITSEFAVALAIVYARDISLNISTEPNPETCEDQMIRQWTRQMYG